MERQNYSSNPTRMDLDSATGVSARRTGVHLPPARQLLELRGSRGQEIPRNPASRQTGQPGDKAAGGARREGRGTPWAAGACYREARARGSRNRSRDLRSGNKQKLVVYRILGLPSLTAVGAAVTTAADKGTGSLPF